VGVVPAHHDDIFPALIWRPASASIRRVRADFQISRSATRSRRFHCVGRPSFLRLCSILGEAGFDPLVGVVPGLLDVLAADMYVARGGGEPLVAEQLLQAVGLKYLGPGVPAGSA
jgi:hypothetical protein